MAAQETPAARLFEAHPQKVVETDVAVIGGGIVGLATAYYLARRHRQVAVLERRTWGWEASGRTAGGVRQQGRDLRELPLAMASVALWAGLDEELDAPTYYRRGGNLSIARDEEELEHLSEVAGRERSHGLTIELVDRDRLRRMIPALSDLCIGGKLCTGDGFAEPWAVVSAFVGALQRLGVQLYPRTEALDVVVEDGRIASILTEQVEFRPRITVNAAGPWAPLLAMRAGVILPIQPVRALLMETATAAPLFEQFVKFGEEFYCRPTAAGTILIGPLGWALPWAREGSAEDPRASVFVPERVAEHLPALARLRIARTWSGLLDATPDLIPIIGAPPELRDYFVAAGFSGHGFCLGPIVGKVLSEIIADGRPSLSIDAFSPARAFARAAAS